MKNIHIENSYNTWLISHMRSSIRTHCFYEYDEFAADKVLNRSWRSMYIEWYLHNIGYWLTLPFCKNKKIHSLNIRFKHVDLEEYKERG